MEKELRLRFLGGATITHGDTPVEGFISAKAQALLCYLAVTGRPHSRQALAGLLWEEMPESAARTNLRQALSNLRRLVGSHLRITRHTVAFNREAPYWLDVEAFETDVGKGLLAEGKNLQPTSLHAAVDLYQGDFLAGFSVRDAPAFEEWVVVEREWLWELAVQALDQLAAYHAARGEYDPATRYVRRLLTLAPWREEAHRRMMLLLACRGQHSAALAQYDTCRRVLAEELGVEPSAKTKALYERLRTAPEPQSNLPPEATSFVGREAELVALSQRLADPRCRLVSIVGPGGIGKTRLALRAAAQQLYMFLDGVSFVSLVDLDTAALLVPTLAETLELTLEGRPAPRTQLLNFLREKELLLILDNFEHLLSLPDETGHRGEEALSLILDILQEAPGVKLLVTSREHLKMRWEWVMALKGLPYPDLGFRISDAGLSGSPFAAVQLFVERAQQARWDFSPEEEGPAMVELCRLVEGMPLAIELAAALVGKQSCAEIAAGVKQNLDLLRTEFRDIPLRHRSVRATFDHSWALLSRKEQQAFARLSVFRGGFSQKAARSVAGATGPILQALVDKSLLRRGASGRCNFHALLRQYAAEKLQAIPQEAKHIGNRHSSYYAAFLRQREAHLKGPRQKEALQQIEREIENVRTGWDWAVTHGKGEEIERFSGSLYYFYEMRGRALEGEAVFRKAVTTLTPPETEETRLLLGRLMARQGALTFHLGSHERAKALLQRSLDILRQAHHPQETAFVLEILGSIAGAQGEYDEARSFVETSLSLYRQQGDHFGSARVLNQLGSIARMRGEHKEAWAFFEEGLTLARIAGSRWMEARMLNGLGTLCGEQGDWPTASRYFEQALQAYRELCDRWGESSLLSNLGIACIHLGNYAKAGRHFEEALSICHETGFRGLEGLVLVNLGLLLHHLGDDDAACKRCRQAVRITEELGERHIQAYALTFLGHALVGLGRLAEAREMYQQALALRRELDQPNLATEPLAGLARVSLAQGDLPQARDRVEEIMDYLTDHTLDGTEEPFLVYLTCYRVLSADRDPRAQEVLDTACCLLREQADKIRSRELQHSFLENVAAHREILGEWTRMNKHSP
ncbi:MAG: tetratricopeptide repeat protein [Chloroflexi bacterium]|nr:MAG: tetratricopeptide repeat protein [Chloroflexota bacterium]